MLIYIQSIIWISINIDGNYSDSDKDMYELIFVESENYVLGGGLYQFVLIFLMWCCYGDQLNYVFWSYFNKVFVQKQSIFDDVVCCFIVCSRKKF